MRPDEYRVSMDAATRETYRLIRGVDRFERVTANVAALIALERERARAMPQVSLWFTASRANIEELPAFVALAAELGVGEVYVQRLVFNGLGLATRDNALHGRLRAREQALLEEAETLASARGGRHARVGLTTPLASLQGAADGGRPCRLPAPVTRSPTSPRTATLPCCISPWVARTTPPILGTQTGSPWRRLERGALPSGSAPTSRATRRRTCRGCGLPEHLIGTVAVAIMG